MPLLDAATLFGVKGLVVVITGGGTGIGFMMAKALEENGAIVYIIGRRIEVLKKSCQRSCPSIRSSLDAHEYILTDLQKHGNIIPLQGDVTSKLELSAIVNKVTDEQGFINVLIANSGMTGPMLDGMPKDPTISQFRDFLWETDSTKFTDTFNVNVTAVFFSLVAFLELLDAGNKKGNVEQKSQIITISSVAGFNRQPIAGYAYSSTKAGATHMMKNFATGLVPYDIRSNVIAPGIYPSELSAEKIEEVMKAGGIPKAFIPLQRPGTIEDMAGAVLYLTSKAGSYLNGNVLVTDGGRLSIIPSTY